MPPDTPSTRNRLVAIAIERILTRGYADVGVQELCAAAQVQKGSFYHFFASKRDLTLAALETHWQRYRHGLETCVTAPLGGYERVQLLFDHLHRQYSAAAQNGAPLTGCPFASLALEVSTHEPSLRAALDAIFADWAHLFERLYTDAKRAGELSAATDPARGGQALLAYLEGVLLLVKTGQNPALLASLCPSRAHFAALAQP